MLDLLDKNILQELEADSRQSNSKIAKKIRSDKNIINYRIERMHKRGIIARYSYITNQVNLGKLSFGILIQLKDMPYNKEGDLIEQINNIKSAFFVKQINGKWDIMIIVIERDVHSFLRTFREIAVLCDNYIRDYCTFIDYAGSVYSHKYLYSSPRDLAVDYLMTEKVVLDETEMKVYDELKRNPKSSLLDIGFKIKKTYDTIKSKFIILKKQNILLRCSPVIDIKLLGYQETMCFLSLSPSEKRIEKLLSFCKIEPHIVRLSKCLGQFNLILTIHHKDSAHLKEILGKIKERFSDIICNFEMVQFI